MKYLKSAKAKISFAFNIEYLDKKVYFKERVSFIYVLKVDLMNQDIYINYGYSPGRWMLT